MVSTLTAVFKDGVGVLTARTITTARIDSNGVTREQFLTAIGLSAVFSFTLTALLEGLGVAQTSPLYNPDEMSFNSRKGIVFHAYTEILWILMTVLIGPRYIPWLVAKFGGNASKRDAIGCIYLTAAMSIILAVFLGLINIVISIFVATAPKWVGIVSLMNDVVSYMLFLFMVILIGLQFLKIPSTLRMVGVLVSWYVTLLGLLIIALLPIFYFYEISLVHI